jgi:ABC-type branched-subunit amino acid transport system ATPase component
MIRLPGPNNAGKSATFNILSFFGDISSGIMIIRNENIAVSDCREKCSIGIMMGNNLLRAFKRKTSGKTRTQKIRAFRRKKYTPARHSMQFSTSGKWFPIEG